MSFSCFIVCEAVKIKAVNVPSTYVLDDDNTNPEPLILDCIYDVDAKESGFVLKWYLNNIQIYQWIPSRPAFSLVRFTVFLMIEPKL